MKRIRLIAETELASGIFDISVEGLLKTSSLIITTTAYIILVKTMMGTCCSIAGENFRNSSIRFRATSKHSMRASTYCGESGVDTFVDSNVCIA